MLSVGIGLWTFGAAKTKLRDWRDQRGAIAAEEIGIQKALIGTEGMITAVAYIAGARIRSR